MSVQKYGSYSTNELRIHFCPNCGRQLEIKREMKIVSKTDSDADYWYSQAEVDGYWPNRSKPLKVYYADYFCTHCNEHYSDKEATKLSMKKKDRRSIISVTLGKKTDCLLCGHKLKKKLRKFCVSIELSSENKGDSIGNSTFNMIIPYYVCTNCKNEIYPESNCEVKKDK